MLKIAILTGSTRPGRNNEAVAASAYSTAQQRNDAEFELVDIATYNLPLLDEPVPALYRQYSHDHTKAWSNKIASFGAYYVFVTPEYNRSTSAALKNALDFLYWEWSNKAAGFVSYGGHGGVHAVDHLRSIMTPFMVATVAAQMALSLFTDFENFKTFKPAPQREKELTEMLNQLVAWGAALKTLHVEAAEATRE
jgi:NAD(P)H-dependent FMN reductase